MKSSLGYLGAALIIVAIVILLGLFSPFPPVATPTCSLSFFGLFCIVNGTAYSYNPYNTYLAVGLAIVGAVLLLRGRGSR